MTESGDRVALACPSCTPHGETVHEVLRPGGHATVRCTDCDHTHKTELPETETTDVTIVISQDGDSFTTEMAVPAAGAVTTGEEFVVDTPDALMQVRITGIELGPEQRTDGAALTSVETLWTRAVDNVSVDITLHPKDGDADHTRSIHEKLDHPGDMAYAKDLKRVYGRDETLTAWSAW